MVGTRVLGGHGENRVQILKLAMYVCTSGMLVLLIGINWEMTSMVKLGIINLESLFLCPVME